MRTRGVFGDSRGSGARLMADVRAMTVSPIFALEAPPNICDLPTCGAVTRKVDARWSDEFTVLDIRRTLLL